MSLVSSITPHPSDSRSVERKTKLERVVHWLSLSSKYRLTDGSSAPLSENTENIPHLDHDSSNNIGQTCKSCRERNSKCDGKHPRCSSCLYEQLMCFYVGSSRK
ncbi:hypothetical protein BGW36DRAFT_389326 [Talaromyces proteolyticus]|uniref:Zn(2)-C6 fungal-type domain-containing protein n=1 Tax=Talaromyces proteolyticus TaxID=1131652 RepID=A0AAD4PTH2_9EURO|nr:uncharacterized protein BGW36DRAFT_389326 [Talaromyces proteolyticus]KAH8690786.1 hypothetical protein BGW36DRAFT_389326 [Talaromyces proteolyticus]